MHPAEQNLRDAGAAFSKAFTAARAAGFSVLWPSRPEHLASLAISQTASVDMDGVIEPQPLDLTEEERVALPKIGEATGVALTAISLPTDGVERDVPLAPAKSRKK